LTKGKERNRRIAETERKTGWVHLALDYAA
jgi:hypothetical protein